MDRGVLRELFRNLQAWEAMFEADPAMAVITGPDHQEYHLADIQYLFSCRVMLSYRQRQSIEMCLYHCIPERAAAKLMQVSPENPVASYATSGLNRILEMIENGELPRFKPESKQEVSA